MNINMGWHQLPVGIDYYSISEELNSLVYNLLSFVFNMSFPLYLLFCILFMIALFVVSMRIISVRAGGN